jgi:hypothetical protein
VSSSDGASGETSTTSVPASRRPATSASSAAWLSGPWPSASVRWSTNSSTTSWPAATSALVTERVPPSM